MISKHIPEPSSGLICSLSALCTGLIFIIIILIVTMTRNGVDETKNSLEVKLKNMSVELHSKVNHLYEDNYRMMEKLTGLESYMKDFKDNNVTKKVEKIVTIAKFLLSDEVAGALSSDNQRILAAVGKLTDGILNKNGSANSSCDPGWVHKSFNCYYLSRSARPFNYAKKQCENKKAHLVVVNGLDEMNFLRNLSHSESLWIGLSTENGAWKWVDGTSYEATPKFWKQGYPYKWYFSSEGWCTVFEDGENWSSDWCERSYQYVCEKKTLLNL